MENGKRFWGYLRNHIKWYLLIMLNGLLMAVMMLLNGIVYEEVCYGFLLCVVVLIVVAAADYYVYDKTCRKLSVLRHSVTLSLQGLPETRPDGILYDVGASDQDADRCAKASA